MCRGSAFEDNNEWADWLGSARYLFNDSAESLAVYPFEKAETTANAGRPESRAAWLSQDQRDRAPHAGYRCWSTKNVVSIRGLPKKTTDISELEKLTK